MEKELNIDWANLSFGYIPTDYNVRCTYKNGEWGEIEVSSSELIPMHMAASCLHYGQEAFEGLKAFRGKDGQVRVFRMDENAKRIQRSAEAHYDAGVASGEIHGDGENGCASERTFHPALRQRSIALHPSARNRYVGSSWR